MMETSALENPDGMFVCSYCQIKSIYVVAYMKTMFAQSAMTCVTSYMCVC